MYTNRLFISPAMHFEFSIGFSWRVFTARDFRLVCKSRRLSARIESADGPLQVFNFSTFPPAKRSPKKAAACERARRRALGTISPKIQSRNFSARLVSLPVKKFTCYEREIEGKRDDLDIALHPSRRQETEDISRGDKNPL